MEKTFSSESGSLITDSGIKKKNTGLKTPKVESKIDTGLSASNIKTPTNIPKSGTPSKLNKSPKK
jgi:hypothetical protein